MSTRPLPRRTKRQATGLRGEVCAELALTPIAVVNRLAPDVGFDFLCHVLDGENVTADAFFVQVKAFARNRAKPHSIEFRTATLNLWCSSTIPTYLFVVHLREVPELYWINTHELLARNEILPHHLETEALLRLSLEGATLLDPNTTGSLLKSVRAFQEFQDKNYEALGQIAGNHSSFTDPDDPNLLHLAHYLGLYYIASKPATTALLLEAMIASWERLGNRFAWGYPVRHLRLGLRTGDVRGIVASIKALLYMESDVIHMVDGDLRYCRDNTELDVRKNSMLRALQAIHYTPHIQNDHFADILATKVASISFRIFFEREVVPTLDSVRQELTAWAKLYPKGRTHLHGMDKDVTSITWQALERLKCYDNECECRDKSRPANAVKSG